jgi:hypothetical protein
VQAVVLPLEVQIKDHKAQLQSRLDNLAKINEKTSSINEQMAVLKSVEQDLRKQREMIEGLVARVSAHEARASLESDAPAMAPPRPEQDIPVELMQTTRLSTFEARMARPPAAAPAPAVVPAAAVAPVKAAAQSTPMVSDDLMAALNAQKPSAAPPGPATTQKLPPGAERTQRLNTDGESTQRIAPIDPAFKPEATQIMEVTQKMDAAAPPAAAPAVSSDAETTQRIDDSIWRLQEAKRILSGINPK